MPEAPEHDGPRNSSPLDGHPAAFPKRGGGRGRRFHPSLERNVNKQGRYPIHPSARFRCRQNPPQENYPIIHSQIRFQEENKKKKNELCEPLPSVHQNSSLEVSEKPPSVRPETPKTRIVSFPTFCPPNPNRAALGTTPKKGCVPFSPPLSPKPYGDWTSKKRRR